MNREEGCRIDDSHFSVRLRTEHQPVSPVPGLRDTSWEQLERFLRTSVAAVIAQIKVLGLRAANAGALRAAATGVMSYLQGGDGATIPATKSPSAEPGGSGVGGCAGDARSR